VQTTLLGIAIAIILALLAALTGPYFMAWDKYRSEFEIEASRVTGAQVHVVGPIEARLLPTPALTLQDIAVAWPGDSSPLRARSLVLFGALGALLRGEWRVSKARLEGSEITVGIDQEGRLDWPLRSAAIPEAVAIEQLEISDGRITLADAARGSHFTLENFEFKGEVRSLVGPAKGEGAFVVAGQHYPYKIAAGQVGDDGGVWLHLDLDPFDQPLAADIDALVAFEHGKPRLDGNVRLGGGSAAHPMALSSRGA
jgi:large subunit ribosomal protein L24